MIKFKNKKNDFINIYKAEDLKQIVDVNKEQTFLRTGYNVIEYINDKINEAILNDEVYCIISEVYMTSLLNKNNVDNPALYIAKLLHLLKDKYGYSYQYKHGNPNIISLYFFKING